MDNEVGSKPPNSNRKGYIPARCVKFIQTLYERKRKSNNESLSLLATSVIAIAAILSFIVALIQACIFSGQLTAMRSTDEAIHRQLTLLETDQRPWISVAGIPTIIGPLHMLTQDWAAVDLRFTIKNSGKNPARRVAIVLEMIGLPEAADLIVEQKRFCSKINDPLPPSSEHGEFTVFPGDVFLVQETVSVVEPQLKKMRELNVRKHAIVSAIVGCVVYQFISGTDFHQTGIIFRFERKTATSETNLAIDLDEGSYQPNDLVIDYSMMGNGPAD